MDRVGLEKLIVANIVKKFPISFDSRPCSLYVWLLFLIFQDITHFFKFAHVVKISLIFF